MEEDYVDVVVGSLCVGWVYRGIQPWLRATMLAGAMHTGTWRHDIIIICCTVILGANTDK